MTTLSVIIDHVDINVRDLADARQFYRPPHVRPEFREGCCSADATDPDGNGVEATHFTRSATGGDR